MASKPDKYQTHVEGRFLEIEKWLRDGLTDRQIAKNLGIAYSTLRVYKDKHSALSALFKNTKVAQVAEVENALFKSAKGYHYQEDQVIKIKDEEGFEKVEVVTVIKFMPANIAAAIFFLTNKDPEQWANNKHMVEAKWEELRLREQEMKMRNF